MDAIKAVRQNYKPTEEMLSLLDDFRCMVNDCVRIGLKEGVTSTKSLSLKAYHQLKAYDIPTCYRLTAISKAVGMLRNYRREVRKNSSTKVPYAKSLVLTDCYGFRITDGSLRLPLGDRRYTVIPLNSYTRSVISGLTTRSITLTPSTASLTFSKETVEVEPAGLIGMDRNLDNVALADSLGKITRYDLGKATRVKARCRETERHLKRNDIRIRRAIFGKYGTIQKNRVGWILHNISSSIIEQAKKSNFGIVMEDIKGIRKLYRKGNGQGREYRARLNSWSYYELQRQIEYKARWEGIPVIYVDARGTSAKCATCGSKTFPNADRTLFCPNCRKPFDRDENAARNILAKGAARFAADGWPGETVKGNEMTAPLLRADGHQLSKSVTSVPIC